MAGHPESDDDVTTDSSTPAENAGMRQVDLDAVVRRQTLLHSARADACV